MKYIKGSQKYKLDDCKLIKVRLHDTKAKLKSVFAETLWARIFKDEKHSVLQNNALAFMPFHSWGAVIPSTTDFDFTDMLNGQKLELHPEAWDAYIIANIIDEDGNYLC